jgi:hypothetical protein
VFIGDVPPYDVGVTHTPLGPTNNPGKARWCEDHGRLECTRNRTKGRGQCHQAAVRGTDACKNHSGYSLAVTKAQGEARITAWSPVGPTVAVDASSAVLGVLQMTHLRLAAYAELLRRQVVKEGDTAGELSESDTPEASGLIGFRYGMGGKDGITYVQTEEIRALVALEAAERDRVVKYAKTAHDMGISDRLTNLAERWGDIVATRISLMLDGLQLTPDQAAMVPQLLQLHLGSIDMTALGAPE